MGEEPTKSSFGALWSELKRRRVIRVIAIYAVVGWVVIEVASTVLPNLNLPEWTVTLVTILIVLGFPITVIMAWVFDIGPGGVQKTSEVAEVIAPAVAVEASAEEPIRDAPAKATHTADTDDRRSVAVLPFVNMSGDPENEYFSDGISEEILNLLVKLPQLRVASRTSSFILKGKEVSIPQAAAELGVSTILEGSVRRAGDRVRITAQLIDVATDSHLWSETYDREMKDVFAIQDDIAQSITTALALTLTPKERRSIQYVATSNPKAYDFYLRGRSYMYTMTRRDYEYAIRMFRQAIDLDPKYALAYAGIADAYSHLYRYADASKENVNKAMDASNKAIALDPDSAEAHASRGLALYISENYQDAETEFREAIKQNPNLYEAYYYFGLAYSSQSKFEEAIQMYKKAMEVNPADYQSVIFLAQAYSSLGRRHEEMKARLSSLDLVQRHLEMNPHDTRALYVGANQLCNVGEHEKGLELAERALGPDEKEPVVLYNVACFFAMAGDSEKSLDLLERAVENGWGDRAWLETDSDLESLRDTDRFKAILDRVDDLS
jgi:adenylate cyclase